MTEKQNGEMYDDVNGKGVEELYQWYYENKGQRHGPVEEKALLKLIENKELNRNSLVWRTGMKEWAEASAALEFEMDTPPLGSGAAINNRWGSINSFVYLVLSPLQI